MNRKILLLDFDGVVSPGKYFSEIYSETFNVPIEKLTPFFETKKKKANIGKADLKELLANELEVWEWAGTVDELVNYWFEIESNIDERFIDLTKTLRKLNVEVYLLTDQEKYRTDYIWNVRNLKDWLDGIFVSHEIGFEKSDSRFFEHVLTKLNILNPSEVLFFDDSTSKVNSAKKTGIDAHVYNDFDNFRTKVLANFK